LVTGVKS